MSLEQCSDNRNGAQTLSRGLDLLKHLAKADEDMVAALIRKSVGA